MIVTVEVSHVNLDMEETILIINFPVYLEMAIFEKRNLLPLLSAELSLKQTKIKLWLLFLHLKNSLKRMFLPNECLHFIFQIFFSKTKFCS